MASVDSEKSVARQELDIALGEQRVPLSGLSVKEFDDLLRKTMYNVGLRELRGFRPLREFLRYHTNNPSPYNSGDIQNVELGPSPTLEVAGFDDAVDFDTHVLSVTRGIKDLKITWKRLESGEETQDRNLASSWGRTAYIWRQSAMELVLRRPHNHSSAADNLAMVWYSCEKVVLQRMHHISSVKVVRLPIENFRQHFGEAYPDAAAELISELRTAHSRTLHELESQVVSFRRECEALERLSSAITGS